MGAASVVGTLVEAYDFILFGLGAALVFAERFFPAGRPGTGLLASLLAFAVGFLARPAGGLVLGRMGDRVGRTPIMVFTLVLMGAATLGIGLLPTYAVIGVAAPLLLVTLRLLQGFGAGAEYVGAVLVLAESGDPRSRGLRASLPSVGYFAGVVLATLAFTGASATTSEAEFAAWGWRVPFLLSPAAVLIGLYFRLAVGETTAFRKAGPVGRPAIAEMIRGHRRPLLIAVAANGPMVAVFYLVQVFVLSYVTGAMGISETAALAAGLGAFCAAIITLPMFGWAADRIGRRPVWFAGSGFITCLAFPMFWMIETRNVGLIVLAMALAMAGGVSAMGAAQAALFPEMFATRYRFTGVACAREFSAALIGGPTPYAAAALLQTSGGSSWPIAVLMMICGSASFAAVLFAPETRSVNLTAG